MLRCRWLLVMEPTCDQEELWSVYRLRVIPLDTPGESMPVVVHSVDELVDALFAQWNSHIELLLPDPPDAQDERVKG
jgi:hypothetical protein